MLRRLRSDERGLAALEFALIAPVMVLLYYGLSELTLGMMAERRASHAASVVADLVAQSNQIGASEMNDIFQVGDAILEPFPSAPLKIRVTSVKADSYGTPRVVWSQGDGMGALGSGSGVSGFPSGLLAPGDSVIMAEVSYTYDSPIHETLPGALGFSQKFYLRPRRSPEVTWTG